MDAHLSHPASSPAASDPVSAVATVEMAAIARALLTHPVVADCAVVARDGSSGPELVAYVVAVSHVTAAQLRAHAARAGVLPRVSIVHVSTVPLSASGEVDEAALAALPVLDDDLVHACVERLTAASDGPASAARVRASAPPPPLHVWDLVPELAVKRPVARADAPAAGKQARGPVVRPSIARGAALADVPGRPRTLPETIARAARERADRGVTFVHSDGREETCRYPELLDEAHRILGGLRRLRLTPGDKVIFQFDRNRDFLPAFWGCVLGGFVPVPVGAAASYGDDNSAVIRLQKAWEMLHGPVVLAGDAVAPAIAATAARRGLGALRVEAIGPLRGAEPDPRVHAAAPADVALMMLTSGSTGIPKGVQLTHANLIAQLAAAEQMRWLAPDAVTLSWMPLDHVAGIIYFHLRDLFLGLRQVHMQTDVVLQNPVAWLDAIHRHRAAITFAPNFAFGLVNDCADAIARAAWDLSCLQYIVNAAEAIVSRTVRRFLSLLAPHGLASNVMTPAWGMSETTSGAAFSRRFSLESTTDEDAFVELGDPIPGVSLRIVDEGNAPVEEGTIGRLQVTGPTLMPGYFERPDLNAASFTADGWFDTGDLAIIRDGRLTLTGREKDDIVINSVKYYSHEIEGVVDELPIATTSFTAACPVRSPGADTEELAVFFVPASPDAAALAASVAEIRRVVSKRVGVAPAHVLPVTTQDIPKTGIGKIQRSQIRQRFEEGGFDGVVKRVDVLTRSARTVPDWFYRRQWRPKRGVLRRALPGTVLALVRDREQHAALERALGVEVIGVEPGDAFERSGPASYRVRPESAGDYAALVRTLRAAGHGPDVVVGLWGLGGPASAPAGSPEAARHAAAATLALVQGLSSAHDGAAPVELVLVSRQALGVADGERLDPATYALGALLKTAAQEQPWLNARQVDLGREAAGRLGDLRDELTIADREPQAAYRGGERFVARLARVEMAGAAREPLPFVRGGLYAISGGLGGMSLELSRYLLRDVGARLLLLGRTSLDSAEGDERTAAARQALAQLAALGSVRYEAIDVCDRQALAEAAARAAADWGCSLAGALHLAGVYHERLLADETAETFAAALRAKIDGAAAMAALVAAQPGAVFIASSSVNGWFGGVGAGAYATANAYLDAFVDDVRAGGTRAHALAWSLWDEVGMSRGYALKDLSRARGYLPISPAQGVHSFLAALARAEGHVLIGLDGTSPYVSARTDAPVRLAERLTIEVADVDGRAAAVAAGLRDRFDVPLAGTVSLADARAGAERGRAERIGPRTETEHAIARAWRQVLQIEDVDVDANFFDLGGSSILMAQVYRQLSGGLPGRLSMIDLFTHPTIGALASHLDAGGAAPDDESDRGRGQQRRERMQRLRSRASGREDGNRST